MSVYLDYNATTPVDHRVFEAMQPYFMEEFGNAGSRTHLYGQRAKEAVERARQQVASAILASPEEVIFTSGATESNNIAILGLAAWGEATRRKHILSTAIEHKAVLEPFEHLARRGFEIELTPVTSGGFIDAADLVRRIRPDTMLVSVMHANNETGILQPILEVGHAARERGVYFHVDAAQTFGKEIEELQEAHFDLLSISGHKVYAPKGIGALYIRRYNGKRIPIEPLMYGGGQERGLRPGTQPVALIVGLGKAAELAKKEYLATRTAALTMKHKLISCFEGIAWRPVGDMTRAQAHVLNAIFQNVESEALLLRIREHTAASNGSACTSNDYRISHVLKAMGCSNEEAASAIRFSWGKTDFSNSISELVHAIRELQELAALS